jgi:hypothetical protein
MKEGIYNGGCHPLRLCCLVSFVFVSILHGVCTTMIAKPCISQKESCCYVTMHGEPSIYAPLRRWKERNRNTIESLQLRGRQIQSDYSINSSNPVRLIVIAVLQRCSWNTERSSWSANFSYAEARTSPELRRDCGFQGILFLHCHLADLPYLTQIQMSLHLGQWVWVHCFFPTCLTEYIHLTFREKLKHTFH